MTARLPPIAAQRVRNANIREQAERIARSVELHPEHAPVPVVVVPANTRETEPLPPRSRRAFLERLQATVQRVYTVGAINEDALATAEESAAASNAAAPGDDAAILGRSCATCRGECCTAGGDHAFLRDDSITRVRATHVALDEDGVLALYAAHLPSRHYRGSCVYHTTDGCALPRALRSNLCNRYVCGGVTQLRSALASSGASIAFIAAADSVHVRRMALINATESRPIALTSLA